MLFWITQCRSNKKINIIFGLHRNVKDAKSAIKKIKNIVKHVSRKNVILMLEFGGIWIHEMQDLALDNKEKEAEEVFNRKRRYFEENVINKILAGENVESNDFFIKLLKFATKKGFQIEYELPSFKYTWMYYVKFDESFQEERDELLVERIVKLKQEYPAKELIVIRGSEHINCLPDLLEKNQVSCELMSYSDS